MLKVSTRALYETGWRERQADARAKGECGKYVGRGRFAEKGGGQQVGSAFSCSSDNEKIKSLYGNYGFWAWLRYWYLDSADFISLMLVDKGYYDYDFTEPKRRRRSTANVKLMSDDEVAAVLSTAIIPGTDTLVHSVKPTTPSALQAEVMEEERKKQHR